MALAVEAAWPASAPLEGIVITRYGHAVPTRRIRVVEAGHPVPDERGKEAARDVLRAARGANEDDLLLALISGGGSALLALPADGIPMADLQSVTRQLLASGAPIQDMNTVRKHLSSIQGGRLAAATRARVLALAISDVTGDDPTFIASGPCAPDPTTYADAIAILERHEVDPPDSIARHLAEGLRGAITETPKPGDALFARVENRVIATARQSLEAGAAYFRDRGIAAVVLGDTVTGESREVAKPYAALAREISLRREPFAPPVALISGGETTVTLRGDSGRGGRCSEFLLSLALALDGIDGAWALACDTDGIDGVEDNAGAILAPDSLARARRAGLEPKKLLARNDAYTFFHSLDDLVMTGPTRTNVNDYRVILLGAQPA